MGAGGTTSASTAGAATAGRVGEGGAAAPNGGAGQALAGANMAGVPERRRSVCENEIIVGPRPIQEGELGFVGTFDGQATELIAAGEQPGIPTFSILRLGQHFEAVYLSFSMTAAPGTFIAQISVANCVLNAQLLAPSGDSLRSLSIETGWLRSTTITPDWETGTAAGSLHIEIVDGTGSERHVLDGRFVLPAAMPDARM